MKNKFSIAMTLAVMMAMLLTSLALADVVTSDVVLATVGNQTFIDLGNVTPGQVISTATSFQLECNGSNHADQGNTVFVQFFSVNPAGNLTATDTSIGPIPADWADDANGGDNCANASLSVLNDNGNSTVTITAPTISGTYNYVVTYKVCQSNNAAQCGGIDPNDVTGAIPAVTFRITVVSAPSDTTPPAITPNISGTLGNNGWYTSNVTVSWSVVDNESAISSTSGCDPTTINTDIAGVTLTCTATSAGGTSSQSVTIKRDATAPTISGAPTISPNGNGWYNGDVTVHFTCADAMSGVASCSSDQTLSSNGANQSASGTVADNAGNSASTTVSGINIDKAKPVISGSRTPAANANGWNNTDVVVSFSCTDSGGSDININTVAGATVSAEGAGQSVTNAGTCTDKAGNMADSATIGNINIDKTAPTLSGVATTAVNSNGWYNGDVTIHWTCGDSLSGVDGSCPADSLITGEGNNLSAGASVSDLAGNSASATVSGIQIDRTPPTASANPSPAANANGWNNTDVTVSFSGIDGLSGIDFCSTPVVLGSEGASQSASGTCTDKAGNVSALAAASGINIDKTPPSASASASPAPNSNGWNNMDVTVSFSGSDSLSGLDSCSSPVVLSSEGAGQSASGQCTDKAGNVSTSATVSGINIDKTAPTLNIVGAANGNYGVCAIPSKPTFGPTDSLSLVASQNETWTTPVAPSVVGTYTYYAIATDNAGNITSETRTYTVNYGNVAIKAIPFLQPINTDGSSRFKLGSTIPVKFQAMCSGTPITVVVAKLNVKQADGNPDPGVDEAISTSAATTGNLFRYDSTGQQYIFNLSTKIGYTNPTGGTVSFTSGTWTISILLDDGTYRSINIQLVR